LDQYQVGWCNSLQRHLTTAMLAAAYFAVIAAASPKARPAWSGFLQPRLAISWHN
jgi:hypothetical protein